jgi:hypothetical protein
MRQRIHIPRSWERDVERRALKEGLPPIAGGMPIQSEIVAGFAKEATYGTFVPPAKFVPCVPQIRGNQKLTRPDQARGTRGQVVDVITGYELDISLTGELIPDTWGQLCAGAMGNGSDAYVSASGYATHSLTPQPQLPSFSYEQDTDIVTGEQVLARQCAGCVVDSFQVKATNQSIAQATVALIGQRELTPATPGAPSTPALSAAFFNTIEPMDFSLLAYTYKSLASTQLMDVTLAIANHTQRVFASNGQLYVTRLVPTKREVTLTTLLDFLDTNYYNDWINGAKTSGMVITMTSASNIPTTTQPYSVSFTIPGTRANGEYSLPAASDVIQQNITWSATVSGANEISSVWKNDEAGAWA